MFHNAAVVVGIIRTGIISVSALIGVGSLPSTSLIKLRLKVSVDSKRAMTIDDLAFRFSHDSPYAYSHRGLN